MLPAFASRYPRSQVETYSVPLAQRDDYRSFFWWANAGSSCFWIAPAYIYDCLFREPSAAVFFTYTRPSSNHHVPMIVSVRTWANMLRIYTGWIVAAMQNMFALRYWAIRKCPSYPVSMQSFRVGIIPDKSVAMPWLIFVCNSRARPNPALTKRFISRMKRAIFVYLVPKSIFQWYFNEASKRVYFHAAILLSVVANTRGMRS